MADGSTIEWLAKPGYKGATWNPTRGCARQGAGCDHCWAIGQARRQDVPGGAYEGLTTIRNGRVDWLGIARPAPDMLDLPLHWKNPRCVFVESMGDLWHPGISFDYIAAVFGVMAACPQHYFIILTKQAKRMREWFQWVDRVGAIAVGERDASGVVHGAAFDALKGDALTAARRRKPCDAVWESSSKPWPLPNVALLVSAWDQPSAEKYVPHLLECPAAVRGVSAEPLLGPLDLRSFLHLPPCPQFPAERAAGWGHMACDCQPYRKTGRLDWVIVGGESGNGARLMQPEWARSLREQCNAAGVAYFFKQWGNWAPPPTTRADELNPMLVKLRTKKEGGRVLDGRIWDEFPP